MIGIVMKLYVRALLAISLLFSPVVGALAVAQPVYASDGTTITVDGGQLWKSSDGTIFGKEVPDGFGDSNNYYITPPICTFNNYQYCGTYNQTDGGGIWRRSSPSIPTVSEWGMIILFILLVGSALLVMRRRKEQESR